MVPFLGQGMNAAFEDCTRADEMPGTSTGHDRGRAFAEYEGLRKPHVDALADLCVENFIEMRDQVGSPIFRCRKSWPCCLHALFPRWYLPLYTMIEFTRIPYADARRRARRQDWIVRGIGTMVVAIAVIAIVCSCG